MYEVRFKLDNQLKLATASLVEAKAAATSYGKWNYPCLVIDIETGEIVHESKAYRDTFRPGEPETLGFISKEGGVIEWITEANRPK